MSNISKKGRCEDKKCQGRHRKYCKYYNTKEGCFRANSCSYVLSKNKLRDNNEEINEGRHELTQMYKCYQNNHTSRKLFQ